MAIPRTKLLETLNQMLGMKIEILIKEKSCFSFISSKIISIPRTTLLETLTQMLGKKVEILIKELVTAKSLSIYFANPRRVFLKIEEQA